MDTGLDVIAIFLSLIALIATAINIYLQYYKVDIACYMEAENDMFSIIIENNSNNLAKDFSIQLAVIDAPLEIKQRFALMPLLNRKVSFNLAPKKQLSIFVDTFFLAYMQETETFPSFTVEIFDSKGRSKGVYDLDFTLYYNKMIPYGEEYYLRKEIKDGFRSIEEAIKKKKEG
ncbi:hypothetical protein [Exiguobacterium sp. s22]|uniref:hypothetical protein n=1 Tax=Exiguobacterium sp. s22 TaxID=2751272 RepID=UPI001BE8F228|nr:hypothetical protein [Exiguobacterium sp. s22]